MPYHPVAGDLWVEVPVVVVGNLNHSAARRPGEDLGREIYLTADVAHPYHPVAGDLNRYVHRVAVGYLDDAPS